MRMQNTRFFSRPSLKNAAFLRPLKCCPSGRSTSLFRLLSSSSSAAASSQPRSTQGRKSTIHHFQTFPTFKLFPQTLDPDKCLPWPQKGSIFFSVCLQKGPWNFSKKGKLTNGKKEERRTELERKVLKCFRKQKLPSTGNGNRRNPSGTCSIESRI